MPNSHRVTLEYADFAVALEILNPVGSLLQIRSWIENARGERLESVGQRLTAGLLCEVIAATASAEETAIIEVDSSPRWQAKEREVQAEYGVHPSRFRSLGFSAAVAIFVMVFKRKLEGEM